MAKSIGAATRRKKKKLKDRSEGNDEPGEAMRGETNEAEISKQKAKTRVCSETSTARQIRVIGHEKRGHGCLIHVQSFQLLRLFVVIEFKTSVTTALQPFHGHAVATANFSLKL